ncbi:MAG TPA: helix-turn-helix transcriptional regulator [Sandaracinaceae bacterium]
MSGHARVASAVVPSGGAGASSKSAPSPERDAPVSEDAPAAAGAGEPPRKDKDKDRKRSGKGPGSHPNNVRRLRIERMMSKAELARRANVSVLTIDRVEKGYGCRMDTKRKILEALGLSLADRVRVFGDDE